MEIKIFKSLPDEAKQIRISVFVDEQGFTDEFDEADNSSTHIVAFDGGKPVATARVFYDAAEKRFVIGRIAVVKHRRGENIGTKIIEAAEKEIIKNDNKYSYIHAQKRAVGFYEKLGYASFGEMEPEQGYPHIWMKKKLIPHN